MSNRLVYAYTEWKCDACDAIAIVTETGLGPPDGWESRLSEGLQVGNGTCVQGLRFKFDFCRRCASVVESGRVLAAKVLFPRAEVGR